jgi:hypothetical protein
LGAVLELNCNNHPPDIWMDDFFRAALKGEIIRGNRVFVRAPSANEFSFFHKPIGGATLW